MKNISKSNINKDNLVKVYDYPCKKEQDEFLLNEIKTIRNDNIITQQQFLQLEKLVKENQIVDVLNYIRDVMNTDDYYRIYNTYATFINTKKLSFYYTFNNKYIPIIIDKNFNRLKSS